MKKRMTISDLSPEKGSKQRSWRVGRGVGSGSGKTSSRGHKGYGQRSGSKRSPGFEGGQMPLVRRVPKMGFTSPFRVEYTPVNLSALDTFESGAVVDSALLKERRIANGTMPVKILGTGKLTKKLTVKAHAFSDAAKAAIEAAGGAVEIEKLS